jgi:ADP-dependent NAD(P)H-hydrate dehydratase / NAD(P)H-hydrate epimerase
MIPLFSTSQVRKLDSLAIKDNGMPGILLMENASREIFQIISEYVPYPERAGFLCGKGNNGGDGFAAARHFANAGVPVTVIYLGSRKEMSDDCRLNFDILNNFAKSNKDIKLVQYKTARNLSQLNDCEIIVDTLLGSGASGPLKAPYDKIIEYINALNKIKAAVDIPTGLDADKGYAQNKLKVDLTITLGEYKKGLFFGDGYELCGEVRKGEIGVDPRWSDRFGVAEYLIEPEDAFQFLPEKGRGINKYTSGKVLTIAGSGIYPGAAAMTSKAVLKAGGGSSVLAFPVSAKSLIHRELTEVVVEHYNDNGSEALSTENIKELEKRIKWADVVAIGPGLGRGEKTQAAVLQIIEERKFRELVIDADGLFPLNKNYMNYDLNDIVLTPHLGEFSSLLGEDSGRIKKDILSYGRKFSNDTGCCLVLKGAPTMIFYKDEVFINTSGNPGMAKFGTGDVLTGIISAFLAQGGVLPESVISAVYIHSLTADILKKKFTEYGFTAENIIEYFPEGIKFLKDSIAY